MGLIEKLTEQNQEILTKLDLLMSAMQRPQEMQGDRKKPKRLKEASEYAGVAEVTLRLAVARKQVKCTKQGKFLYFLADDLDAFMLGNTNLEKIKINLK